MLAGGSDEAYRAILATPGGSYQTRVEVWRSGERIDPFGDTGLPLVDGSVSATLQSGVTRTVELTVPGASAGYHNGASLIPLVGGDLLDPLGSWLRIMARWRAGAYTTVWWPVFFGPIIDVDASTDRRGVSVGASDVAEPVIANQFVAPRISAAGALITLQVHDLINDAIDGATFTTFDETAAIVPAQTWEYDRGGALNGLASGACCHWYATGDGSFTLRLIPWAQDAYGPPVVTWSTATGLVRAGVTLSRERVRNTVVVTSDSSAGSVPVSGIGMDEDAASRTRVDGPLGVRVLRLTGQAVTSLGQAQSQARLRVARSRATLESWSTTMVADPSLELGDVGTVLALGVSRSLALTGFRLPLAGAPTMTASWRPAGGVAGD